MDNARKNKAAQLKGGGHYADEERAGLWPRGEEFFRPIPA